MIYITNLVVVDRTVCKDNLKGIDPILETEEFEKDQDDESFIHENNSFLFKDFQEDQSSSEINISTGIPGAEFLLSSIEESEIQKMRRNIVNLKVSKSMLSEKNNSCNKTDILNHRRKNIFHVHHEKNTTTPIQNTSLVNLNGLCHGLNGLNASNGLNIVNINNYSNLSADPKMPEPRQYSNNLNNLNQSASNLSLTRNKRRGRKKMLIDGIKTELLDKAFLREFKSFLKRSKCLRVVYDELTREEKIFWNEFLMVSSPPFAFTIKGLSEKIIFKSYNKELLQFIFSQPSARQLYEIFIKEKEKDFVISILQKKLNKKNIDRKLLLFYTFYGKNLYKLYNKDINMSDFNIEENESNFLNKGDNSLTINNKSNIPSFKLNSSLNQNLNTGLSTHNTLSLNNKMVNESVSFAHGDISLII